MDPSDLSQGYQCEFVSAVSDHYYCKKCNRVAKELHMTVCCGETYCHACIADAQKQSKPCPACGKKVFTIFQQVKFQKEISELQVYCGLKQKGCSWLGTIGQLDAHSDPEQDKCRYVDTKCPLNCQQAVPKIKMEQHVTQECAKRDYICDYCNFKATYEEVVDTHLPECKYFPLQCPNLCGVTCKRGSMEDHLNECPLETISCNFLDVGCDIKFKRESQEEHMKQNTQKHLTMTASLVAETCSELYELKSDYEVEKESQKGKLQEIGQKLVEQEARLKEQNQNSEQWNRNQMEQDQKLKEQNHRLERQEEKIREQELELKQQSQILQQQEQRLNDKELELMQQSTKLTELEKKLDDYQNNLPSIEKKLVEDIKQKMKEIRYETETSLSKYHGLLGMTRSFKMKNFGEERSKDKPGDWKSPVLYTHMCGYKFCIGVDANGADGGCGKAIRITLFALSGVHDGQLKWPAKGKFTIELINQQGGESATATTEDVSWKKPCNSPLFVRHFGRISCGGDFNHFIEHSKMDSYIKNNTLYFKLTEAYSY